MQNSQLHNKQIQLQRRNQQLQDKRRQIQRQLKSLQTDSYQVEHQYSYQKQQQNVPQAQQAQTQQSKDIINQLQSIKSANILKNQSRLAQLKKQFQLNRQKLVKNQQRLQKLQNNIDLAKSAVRMKNQLKQQIEGKGKKLTEQSKKWIMEVGKLNDKAEGLRNTLTTQQKEEQALKAVYEAGQRKLTQIKNQKASYEAQSKTLNSRTDAIKAQIEKAKELIKEKLIVGKQETQKSQKEKQRLGLNQKRLQRQKNQLIKAYKKLSNHINLLRKCNTHLQTANSLGFGLKQYLNAIDKADMIP